jgi:hypothetical protein
MIDFRHHEQLPVLVLIVILDDAQAVDPQKLNAELLGGGYHILDGPGQGC